MGFQRCFLGDAFAAHVTLELWLFVALELDMAPHRRPMLVLFVTRDAHEPLLVAHEEIVQTQL